MPDFERLVRSLRLHNAKTEQERRELLAYYRGLDRARIETAVIVAALIAGMIISHYLL